jgi:hypothetical protein
MRMIGQLICAIGCLLTVGTICGARQVSGSATSNGIPALSQTAASSPELDSLVAQIAQQIVKKHLKSVAVIGAVGPKANEPTEDGKELGDEISSSLTTRASGFQVVDRATLREFVKKNGVSESMMVSDALANWITRKAGVAGYLVIQIGEVSKGRAKIAANLEGLVLICDG